LSYIVNTPDDRRAMLEAIGTSSIADLFNNISPSLRLDRPLAVPAALSEIELTRRAQELAALKSLRRGYGLFPRRRRIRPFHPRRRGRARRPERSSTPPTRLIRPKQVKAVFTSLFSSFKTLICQLTGLDVSNASLYEGGTAVTEAVFMATTPPAVTAKFSSLKAFIPNIADIDDVSRQSGAARRNAATPDGFLNPTTYAAPSTMRRRAWWCSIPTSSVAWRKLKPWPSPLTSAARCSSSATTLSVLGFSSGRANTGPTSPWRRDKVSAIL